MYILHKYKCISLYRVRLGSSPAPHKVASPQQKKIVHWRVRTSTRDTITVSEQEDHPLLCKPQKIIHHRTSTGSTTSLPAEEPDDHPWVGQKKKNYHCCVRRDSVNRPIDRISMNRWIDTSMD